MEPDHNGTLLPPLCAPLQLMHQATPGIIHIHIIGVIIFLLGVIGVAGVLMTLVQLRKQSSSVCTIRFIWHIRFLCFWDVMVLALACSWRAFFFCMWLRNKNRTMYTVFNVFVYFAQPIARLALFGAQWQAAVLAFERLFMVWHPLKSLTPKFHAAWSFGFIVVIGIVVCIPSHFLHWQLRQCEANESNISVWVLTHVEYTVTPLHNIFFRVIPFVVFFCPLPFVCLCVSTLATKVLMHQAADRHNRSRTQTNIILLMNVKYLLCNVMTLVATAASVFDNVLIEMDMHSSRMMSILTTFLLYSREASDVTLALHSATNWLLFVRYATKNVGFIGGSSNMSGGISFRAPCPTDQAVTNQADAKKLYGRWKSKLNNEFGRILLVEICLKRPELGLQLYNNKGREQLMNNVRLASNGGRITQCLGSILFRLSCHRVNLSQLRDELHHVGAVHSTAQVRLSNEDWLFLMEFLDEYLVITNVDEKRAMRRISAFVVNELKRGYMCEQVKKESVLIKTVINGGRKQTHAEQERCIRKKESEVFLNKRRIVKPDLAQQLSNRWRSLSNNDFGRQLLIRVCASRPNLGQQLFGCNALSDLCSNTKLALNGGRITQGVGDALMELSETNVDMRSLRSQLQHVGAVHWIANVHLYDADWALIVQFAEHYINLEDKKLSMALRACMRFIVLQIEQGYLNEKHRLDQSPSPTTTRTKNQLVSERKRAASQQMRPQHNQRRTTSSSNPESIALLEK